MMSLGRIVLLLVSAKKLEVCQYYIYYQVVYVMIEECLPRNYGDM